MQKKHAKNEADNAAKLWRMKISVNIAQYGHMFNPLIL